MLHFGNLGGVAVKIVTIGGIMMAVTLIAGTLWIKTTQDSFRARMVERLLNGFSGGLLIALLTFAWSTRILPYGNDGREATELSWFMVHGYLLLV